MEDLHIIQKPNQENSPFIFASEKRKILKIHKWYSFDKTTWNSLVNWIREYQSRNEALLTYEGFIGLPDSWEYEYFDNPSSSTNTAIFLISNLFGNILENFNFYSKGGSYPAEPTFIGNMNDNLIKISGQSYSSYTGEVFMPFFNWIEIYLKTNPNKIRVEFWLTYINTSATKKIFDLIDALNNYRKKSNSKVEMFWYVEEDDKDMIEAAGNYKEEVPSLEIVMLDKGQWERMCK